MSDLFERARAWIVGDPDALTRTELQTLIDTDDLEELSKRMNGSLEFGTPDCGARSKRDRTV